MLAYILEVTSLGNFKWSFYSHPYPLLVSRTGIIRGEGEEKIPTEPLYSNGQDFNGYLNSTFKPDLNTKNVKEALCQIHESKMKCEFVQRQMEGFALQ